jgi:hypothetical protein
LSKDNKAGSAYRRRTFNAHCPAFEGLYTAFSRVDGQKTYVQHLLTPEKQKA